MDLIKGIRERRSVRRFKDIKINHDIIGKIVEDASYAPSWKHTQIVRYTYLENRELIIKIAKNMILGFSFNEKTFESSAGIMIVSYVANRSGFERDGSYSTPKKDGFEMFDAGAACQTFCLAAEERGIGTVITGYFDEKEIGSLINMPENQKIAALICMGYPDETPNAPKRKEVSELLRFL